MLPSSLLAMHAIIPFYISFSRFLNRDSQPTPMLGTDDAYKTDNHVNHDGFRQEEEAIFQGLVDNDFFDKNLYIICGDRHWQYHAMYPSGIEEFSTGALVDNNSRVGRLAGDPDSTDPDSLIVQCYIQGGKESASGKFL